MITSSFSSLVDFILSICMVYKKRDGELDNQGANQTIKDETKIINALIPFFSCNCFFNPSALIETSIINDEIRQASVNLYKFMTIQIVIDFVNFSSH